jgi:hypothetical protein
MVMMAWQCCKMPDGVLAQNGAWGIMIVHGYESETHIGRYIGKMQWLMPFVGFDWRYRKLGHNEVETNLFGQKSTKDNRTQFSLGFAYTLPCYHSANKKCTTMVT